MDDYRWNYHVPAFGSWGYGNEDDGMPYTQCFESAARQANNTTNLARFAAYSDVVDERDLYVTGDLYQNNVVTPAVIVVPRRSGRKGYSSSNVKGVKKQQQSMVQKKQDYEYEEYGGGYSYDIKQPPSPILSPPPKYNYKPKPVDEDLYKIPPEFLHVKPKRKKGLGLFSSCLMPACA